MHIDKEKFTVRFLAHHRSEQKASIVLFGIGCLSICLALLGVIFLRDELYHGLASCLVPIGIGQLLGAVIFYFKSSNLIKKSKGAIAYTPKKFIQDQVKKVNALQRQQAFFRKILIVPMLIGFIVCFLYISDYGRPFSLGVGIGLVVHGGVIMVYQLMMHWRLGIYAHQLHKLDNALFHI